MDVQKKENVKAISKAFKNDETNTFIKRDRTTEIVSNGKVTVMLYNNHVIACKQVGNNIVKYIIPNVKNREILKRIHRRLEGLGIPVKFKHDVIMLNGKSLETGVYHDYKVTI